MMARRDRPFKLVIHEGELDRITEWVLASEDIETGGNLFGLWTHSGAPTVQLVVGPGARARHGRTSFFQDVDHVNLVGGQARDRHGLQHVGDWHSHHTIGLKQPSRGDVATAFGVFDTTPLDRFMLMIATIEDLRARRVEVGAFLFERGVDGYRTGRWVVLSGDSPVAGSLRPGDGPSKEPRAKRLKSRSEVKASWQVPRTTLDSPDGSPMTPKPGWYTEDWGTALLRCLDILCQSSFADGRIGLDEASGRLSYRFRSADADVALVFPAAYPHQVAEITVARGGTGRTIPVSANATTAKHLFAALMSAVADAPARQRNDPNTEESHERVEREPAAQADDRTGDPGPVLPGAGVAAPEGPGQDGAGGPVPDQQRTDVSATDHCP
ncbi:Mov34/MPN/PAD-1 family protein [Actinokineospora sp. 24-640]